MNSQTAEVMAVRGEQVGFRLEDGRMLDMNAGDPQLRHIDRSWASTVHAFQGRTVDTVIAAIEANHPNLTNRKMLYVEISRARDHAEFVTDDKVALREQLQAVTGERIAALEGIGHPGTGMPASPFWVDETMPKGGFVEIDDPEPKVTLVLLENVGTTIPGLRLADGALVLRIARGRKSRKVCIPDADASDVTRCGLAMKLAVDGDLPENLDRAAAVCTVVSPRR